MNFQIKLFNFYGTPVYLKLWFLLLFLWVNPLIVVSIFISLLLHELAHGFVAHRLGYHVSEIYLNIFNGAAVMDIDQMDTKHAFKITAAGPWINFMLMALCMAVSGIYPSVFLNVMVYVNFFLVVFNLIPIYPLDGGRMLRYWMISKTGNYDRSIRIGSIVSLVCSSLMIIYYLINFSPIMLIFAGLFLVYNLKELGLIKF